MADIITLTHQPIRVTGAERQQRYLATDVSAFDILDMQLFVTSFEGTGPLSATLKLISSMQMQTDSEGWSDVWVFNIGAGSNVSHMATISSGFLRYLRWEVSSVTGTSPAVTFWLRGLGRSYK